MMYNMSHFILMVITPELMAMNYCARHLQGSRGFKFHKIAQFLRALRIERYVVYISAVSAIIAICTLWFVSVRTLNLD